MWPIESDARRNLRAHAGVSAVAVEFLSVLRRGSEERHQSPRRITCDSDSVGVDVQPAGVGSGPANGRFYIFDLSRPFALSGQTILRCDADIALPGKGAGRTAHARLATLCKSAAVNVNDRHPLLGSRSRMVDVQMEIHVSTFSINDIVLDCNIRWGRLLSQRSGPANTRNRSRDRR